MQGPGDLEATVMHVYKSRHMFKKMPAAEVVSILGKYGPWKDALLAAYHRIGRLGHRSKVKVHLQTAHGDERTARHLWHMCMMALQANINRLDELSPWVQNVGLNMARCSGSYHLVNTPSG